MGKKSWCVPQVNICCRGIKYTFLFTPTRQLLSFWIQWQPCEKKKWMNLNQMFAIVMFPLQLQRQLCIIMHVLSSHLHVREQWDQSSGWVGNHISDTPQPSAAEQAADGTDYINTTFPPVFYVTFFQLISNMWVSLSAVLIWANFHSSSHIVVSLCTNTSWNTAVCTSTCLYCRALLYSLYPLYERTGRNKQKFYIAANLGNNTLSASSLF